MAQADLLVKLIRSSVHGDQISVRKISETLIQEEKNKGHGILADRLTKALKPNKPNIFVDDSISKKNENINQYHKDLFYQMQPERALDSLILPKKINTQIKEIVEEQHRSELLHAHNLKARNRLLLGGPPGNGKTTLAEALAYELMYPLFVVKYETLIGSYLGETAGRLKYLMDYVKTQRCVLFFDEFETLGKERGDSNETGEIKRIVSSLLLQIDSVPDYVVVVAASNHPELLDRAVWRRFQVRVELITPTVQQLSQLVKTIAHRCKVNFGYTDDFLAKKMKGLNFAEMEEFCLSVVRRAILDRQTRNAKSITKIKLEQWNDRLTASKVNKVTK